jgi:cell division transport system permease protein
MSTTRTPKVSERVAPKPADPQPRRKSAAKTMMARTSAPCCTPGWKATAPACRQPAPPGQAADRQLFHLPGDGRGAEHAHGPVAAAQERRALGGSWQRAAQISLYLKLDASSRDGEALRDEIKGMPGVADAQYVSREQALEEFQQQSGLGEALRELPDNPLPGVVVVTPSEVDKPALEACDSAWQSCRGWKRRSWTWSGSSAWRRSSSWVTVLSSAWR